MSEQIWISLNEFMKRNHLGYDTAMKLINSGKVEYQKLDSQYKIKVSRNEQINETVENLIRENQELKTTIKTMQNILMQVAI